jgi:hypothetical protein
MPKPNRGWLMIQCEGNRPRYINGQEIPNWQQGPTVLEVVNYLARNGWLLFSDSESWRGPGQLIFMRPKQHLTIRCEEKHPRYINGQEIPDWQQGPTVSEAVSYLSRKGWLLLSDRSAVQLGDGDLTFMRPKQ